jgi:uncharacterized membrane protein
MKTQSLLRDLALNTIAAIAGAIATITIVMSAGLHHMGDRSIVLIPLFIGIPLSAAVIPTKRSKDTFSRRLISFLFAAAFAGFSAIGIVAAMDLYGFWCALIAPLAAGSCGCAASRIILRQ